MSGNLEAFAVNGKVTDGVRIITVAYEESSLVLSIRASQASSDIIAKYREMEKSGTASPDCVVVLEATIVNSAIVFALYELFKLCTGAGGRLYVVGYPKDYIHSLSSLGLTDVPGFELRENLDVALREISKGTRKSK